MFDISPSINVYALPFALSAGIATFLYILWGPSSSRRSSLKRIARKDRCPGLLNQGNTCFLNAVLQACATSHSFRLWLEDQHDKPQCTELTTRLMWLMKVLNNEEEDFDSTDNASPYAVVQALRNKRWIISPDQQDAHELFEVLAQSLDEERARHSGVLSLLDVHLISSPLVEPCCINRNKTVWGGIVRDRPHSYQGLLATKLQCKRCSYISPVRYAEFHCLSLPIPAIKTVSFNLKHLLMEFIQQEYIDGVECVKCTERYRGLHGKDSPSQKSIFTKQTTLAKLPASLCIHIQRTTWLDNGMPSKRYDHISFPEFLSMGPYLHESIRLLGGRSFPLVVPSGSLLKPSLYKSPGDNPRLAALFPNQSLIRTMDFSLSGHSAANHNRTWYRLTAVIEHLGDVNSGHFVTHRRAPVTPGHAGLGVSQSWLYTSDTLVQKSKLQDIRMARAYMLFYERC